MKKTLMMIFAAFMAVNSFGRGTPAKAPSKIDDASRLLDTEILSGFNDVPASFINSTNDITVLIYGQSNAAGACQMYPPNAERGVISSGLVSRCYVSGGVAQSVDMRWDLGHEWWGMDIELSQRLHDMFPDRGVRVGTLGVGGQHISVFQPDSTYYKWVEGENSWYYATELADYMLENPAFNSDTLTAVVWYQGESGTSKSEEDSLRSSFRAKYGDDLIWITCGLAESENYNGVVDNFILKNSIKRELAAEDPLTVYVDNWDLPASQYTSVENWTNGTTSKENTIHLSDLGLCMAGDRVFEALVLNSKTAKFGGFESIKVDDEIYATTVTADVMNADEINVSNFSMENFEVESLKVAGRNVAADAPALNNDVEWYFDMEHEEIPNLSGSATLTDVYTNVVHVETTDFGGALEFGGSGKCLMTIPVSSGPEFTAAGLFSVDYSNVRDNVIFCNNQTGWELRAFDRKLSLVAANYGTQHYNFGSVPNEEALFICVRHKVAGSDGIWAVTINETTYEFTDSGETMTLDSTLHVGNRVWSNDESYFKGMMYDLSYFSRYISDADLVRIRAAFQNRARAVYK